MNIQKKLAGVIAGVVAASFMAINASVVSAQDEIKLVYDLKTYEAVSENSTVTVTSKYIESNTSTMYTFNTGDVLRFEANQTYLKNMPIVSASIDVAAKDVKGNKIINNVTYSKNAGEGIFVNKYNAIVDGTVIFADSDNDGYVEFILPTSTGTEANKLNVTPYSLATLGYVSDAEYGFSEVTVRITYEVPAEIKVRYGNALWSDNLYDLLGVNPYSNVTTTIVDTNTGLSCGDTAFNCKPSFYGATAMTAGVIGDAVYPFKTALVPKGNDNNVIAALQSRKANGNYYTNPVAVINDAIANNDEVVFTFTGFNGIVATEKSKLYNMDVNVGRAYNCKVTPYDWTSPYFTQHLYKTDDIITYGSYSSAWGVNLFTGGVVVNSGITMQLNDTDAFTWGDNTLSFNWSDITSDGKITNAKDFLISMSLYTPVDWYWDTLTVEVVNDTIVEDVAAGAGLEEDATYEEIIAPIDDEEIVEDIIDDEVIDEEPVEEEVLDVVEVIIVDEAPSPATGNKSYAYAAIPVALACAAIIAKKKS